MARLPPIQPAAAKLRTFVNVHYMLKYSEVRKIFDTSCTQKSKIAVRKPVGKIPTLNSIGPLSEG